MSLVSALAVSAARAENPRNAGARPGRVTEGTLFWRTERQEALVPAPVLKTDVHIVVTGIVARASVRQEFINPGSEWADQWEHELSLQHTDEGVGLSVHWARGKIASLLDQRRSSSSDAMIRRAVVELALAHHLVSPYTSLVAIDVTPVRPGNEALHSHALKTNLPHGWDYTAVFGLGQGATEGPVHLALGLIALLLAAGLSTTVIRAIKA